MAELGKIEPERRAACPHCGRLLPGPQARYLQPGLILCPHCKQEIRLGAEAEPRSPNLPPAAPALDLAARMLRWQIQNQAPSKRPEDLPADSPVARKRQNLGPPDFLGT